jgi:AcrR family transcriptional regulator
MPRFIDTDLRTTEMVIGVNRVLVAHGIPGLTMRMIARESGISTGSLFHHFESRERILRIAAHRTGRTLIHGARSDALWIGIDAHLPGDAETLRLTRSWLAWCELWRSESWLEEAVTDLRADERSALAELHGQGISPTDRDALVALPGRPAGRRLLAGVRDAGRASARCSGRPRRRRTRGRGESAQLPGRCSGAPRFARRGPARVAARSALKRRNDRTATATYGTRAPPAQAT